MPNAYRADDFDSISLGISVFLEPDVRESSENDW